MPDNDQTGLFNSGSPCYNCIANCCTYYYVPVNHIDIYNIAIHTHKPPVEFTSLDEPKIPSLKVKIMKRVRIKYFNLALKRGKGDACIFLKNNGKERVCIIHTFKPGICKSYPFINDNGLQEHELKLCPGKWNLKGQFKKEMSDFLWKDKLNWMKYYKLLEEWNFGSFRLHSFRHLLTFLIKSNDSYLKDSDKIPL